MFILTLQNRCISGPVALRVLYGIGKCARTVSVSAMLDPGIMMRVSIDYLQLLYAGSAAQPT